MNLRLPITSWGREGVALPALVVLADRQVECTRLPGAAYPPYLAAVMKTFNPLQVSMTCSGSRGTRTGQDIKEEFEKVEWSTTSSLLERC